mgnify:CR=1 FL=1
MTMEQYLEHAGTNNEEWEKQAREIAEARVKSSLVLQILAREQKISASKNARGLVVFRDFSFPANFRWTI